MEQEISEQPELLAKGAQDYWPHLSTFLKDRKFDMILLTARGSSDNAALYGRYLFETFPNIPVSLAAPSVLTRFGRKVNYKNCLAIGISQSGAAPDVAEVLGSLREDGHTTLGITNTANSPITKAAEHTLLLNTGPERSVAATKTYSCSLLALYEIARCLDPGLPHPKLSLPSEAWAMHSRIEAERASGLMLRNQILFSLGRGFGFATANEAALKLMECALLSCKAYSSADFEHGPKALAGHGCTILSFDGDMPDLRKQGCDIAIAPEHEAIAHGGVPGILKPIWDAMFAQWLALSCARARALDPDVPPHIRKVTETL